MWWVWKERQRQKTMRKNTGEGIDVSWSTKELQSQNTVNSLKLECEWQNGHMKNIFLGAGRRESSEQQFSTPLKHDTATAERGDRLDEKVAEPAWPASTNPFNIFQAMAYRQVKNDEEFMSDLAQQSSIVRCFAFWLAGYLLTSDSLYTVQPSTGCFWL